MPTNTRKHQRGDDVLDLLQGRVSTDVSFRKRMKYMIEKAEAEEEKAKQRAGLSNQRSRFEELPVELRLQIYGHLGISTKSQQLAVAEEKTRRAVQIRDGHDLITMQCRHQFISHPDEIVIANWGTTKEMDERAIDSLMRVCRTTRGELEDLLRPDAALSVIISDVDGSAEGIDRRLNSILDDREFLSSLGYTFFETITIAFQWSNTIDTSRRFKLIEDIKTVLWYLRGRATNLKSLYIILPTIKEADKCKKNEWDDLAEDVIEHGRNLCIGFNRLRSSLRKATIVGLDFEPVQLSVEKGVYSHWDDSRTLVPKKLETALHDWMVGPDLEASEPYFGRGAVKTIEGVDLLCG